MTYRAIYKCRLCGETYKDGETGKAVALDIVSHLVYGTPLNPDFINTAIISDRQIHFCDNDSVGIADFQGFKAVEK